MIRIKRTSNLIHIYALLHAVASVLCRIVGIPDEYILTLITIMMLTHMCFHEGMRLEITACAIVVGNLIGYVLGLAVAEVIGRFNLSELMLFSLSTFITTEILGWILKGVTCPFKKTSIKFNNLLTGCVIISAVLVYAARVILLTLYTKGQFDTIGNAANYIYFITSFCVMTVLVVLVMVMYAWVQGKTVTIETEKRHQAQYRYLRLTQQVNPHFLFNSLNVLDCIVQEGDMDNASVYIHKLSGLYRYLLRNEETTTVKLSEEMQFVDQYIDLMKVRFPEGFVIHENISQQALGRSIIPCAVQLLIENATKHNAIGGGTCLTIDITSDGETISVSNNICPKLTPAVSTGKGLKFLRQQFQDISGKNIIIDETETTYTVTLPLI